MTRYLINDTCVVLDKPLVSGASVKWEGQVTVYNLDDGPCYRCLYPECPKSNVMMSCSANGVFGTAPGMVGTVVATECAKVLLGLKGGLKRKLLLIDLLNMRMKVVKLRGRKKGCFCEINRGKVDTKIDQIDYEGFVGISCKIRKKSLDAKMNVEWSDLEKLLSENANSLVLDVRPKSHYGVVHLKEISKKKVRHLPLGDLKFLDQAEIAEQMPPGGKVFVFCRSGRTSVQATQLLRVHGVEAYNVEGGIRQLMRVQKYDDKLIKNL